MAKDFRAAFSNMNQAVRPGASDPQPIPQAVAPVVKEKKLKAVERRAQLHGVQTYLDDEEYEQLMLTKLRTKKKFEEILHDALVQYMKNVLVK